MASEKAVTVLLSCVLAFLTSVAAAQQRLEEVTPSNPQVGVVSEATVGSPIYTKSAFPIVVTESSGGQAILQADVSVQVASRTVIAKMGDRLDPQVFDAQPAFHTPEEVFFLDRDGNSTFDEIWIKAKRKRWASSTLPFPVPYVISTPEEIRSSLDETFRQELLYVGFSKDTLRLQYREYGKRMAREAFYQDLVYEIESFPITVAFRSMRIEILGADNNQIRYRILSELSK